MTINKNKGEVTLWVRLFDAFLAENSERKMWSRGDANDSDGLFGRRLVAKQNTRFDSTSIFVYLVGYNVSDSV